MSIAAQLKGRARPTDLLEAVALCVVMLVDLRASAELVRRSTPIPAGRTLRYS
jgi:hypothetical protein